MSENWPWEGGREGEGRKGVREGGKVEWCIYFRQLVMQYFNSTCKNTTLVAINISLLISITVLIPFQNMLNCVHGM